MAMGVTEQPARDGQPSTRQERRKAATRLRLLQAAQTLLAEQGTSASLQAIADQADLALGSLHYHFADKAELFERAVAAAQEELDSYLVARTAHLSNPAERLCARLRLYGRLTDTHPQYAKLRVNTAGQWVEMGKGFRPSALLDVVAAIPPGPDSQAVNPELATMMTVSGAIALLARRLHEPQLGPDLVDDYAELVLLLLGHPQHQAHEFAHGPLP